MLGVILSKFFSAIVFRLSLGIERVLKSSSVRYLILFFESTAYAMISWSLYFSVIIGNALPSLFKEFISSKYSTGLITGTMFAELILSLSTYKSVVEARYRLITFLIESGSALYAI